MLLSPHPKCPITLRRTPSLGSSLKPPAPFYHSGPVPTVTVFSGEKLRPVGTGAGVLRLRHESRRSGKKRPTFEQLARETFDWAGDTEGRGGVVEVCRWRLFFRAKNRGGAAVGGGGRVQFGVPSGTPAPDSPSYSPPLRSSPAPPASPSPLLPSLPVSHRRVFTLLGVRTLSFTHTNLRNKRSQSPPGPLPRVSAGLCPTRSRR